MASCVSCTLMSAHPPWPVPSNPLVIGAEAAPTSNSHPESPLLAVTHLEAEAVSKDVASMEAWG